METCTGFDWGRVNFLQSILYGAVFWISARNSIGNSDFIIAGQGLHKVKVSSALHPTSP